MLIQSLLYGQKQSGCRYLSSNRVYCVSAQARQLYHLFATKHKLGLKLTAYGFLQSDRVSMQKEYCFTCAGCVRRILYLPFSFIQRLTLTDSPLSVI